MDKITKSFPVEIVKVNKEMGIVDAIVSVLGNIDLTNDIIHPGAFTKTISERSKKIRVLDNHKTDSNTDVIGKVVSIREIAKQELPSEVTQKYPDAEGGLYTVTQFDMDDDKARNIFNKLANGYIDEWSIGFSIPRGKADTQTVKRNDKDVLVRNIREVILFEYSPVIFGANDATGTIGVKNNELKQRSLLDTYWQIVDSFEATYFNRDEMAGYIVCDIFDNNTMVIRPVNIETNFPYYQLNYYVVGDNDYSFDTTEDWQGGNYMFVAGQKSSDEIEETKAGRVLSQANFDKISKAHTLLMEVVQSANRDDDNEMMSNDLDKEEKDSNTENNNDIIEVEVENKHSKDQADPVNNQSLTEQKERLLKEIDNLINSFGE